MSSPVRTCDASGGLLGPDARSGCDSNGIAFTCSDNQPWAVNDNLAYGFAATAISGGTEESWCCACYAYVCDPRLSNVTVSLIFGVVSSSPRALLLARPWSSSRPTLVNTPTIPQLFISSDILTRLFFRR